MDETDGTVVAMVMTVAGSYRVDADNLSAMVTIMDDDDPPVVTAPTFGTTTIDNQTYTKGHGDHGFGVTGSDGWDGCSHLLSGSCACGLEF